MSKNSKALNMLYFGFSIDICESVFHYKSAKEIWDYLCCHYGSNEEISDLEMITDEENGDDKSEPYTELVEKQDQEEHEFENNIQDLSTPMSNENEAKNFIDNSSQSCLNFIDLNTTIRNVFSKLYASGIKSKKWDKSKKKNLATSRFSLVSNSYGPKKKKVPKFCPKYFFLQKSMNNGQFFRKLIVFHLGKIKPCYQAFKFLRNSKGQLKREACQKANQKMASVGLPKVKIR